jgi:hypothetical protein
MQTDCIIQTDGYKAHFHLHGPTEYPGYVRVQIDLVLDPNLADVSLTSGAYAIAIADLSRFADYFDEHINSLQSHPNYESYVFVEWENAFEAQALTGDVITAEDGTLDGGFSLFFAVNLGKAGEESTDTYAGAVSLIEVPNVMTFVRQLRGYLQALPGNSRD